MANEKVISMQFHPRAFAAFGADLVTNDTVAVTELVKNSYDAFAYSVTVEFAEDNKGKYIQITDDGLGMTSEIIENSWAVIATPYKQKNPTVERSGSVRRVSGNKGLGRFSAARLGGILHIWTQHANDSYLHAKMNWDSFLESNNVNDCRITLEVLPDKGIFNPTGTIIRMADIFDKETRTKMMSRIRSKGNKSTEIKLISVFKDKGIHGWRRNYPVNGHPDFVFLHEKIAIFVDGCFWHGHNCRNTQPKDNEEFWRIKRERNIARDQQVNEMFQNRGWTVIRIWECELKGKQFPSKLNTLLLQQIDNRHPAP